MLTAATRFFLAAWAMNWSRGHVRVKHVTNGGFLTVIVCVHQNNRQRRNYPPRVSFLNLLREFFRFYLIRNEASFRTGHLAVKRRATCPVLRYRL